MGYVIELEAYQGPFDLLLDLISQNEVDIWDIPIATITEQYLNYLYSLQEQDLAITGEFLVMAATLIRIKSRLLLPQESTEDDHEEDLGDPRAELVEQLLRYKFFKEVASYLQERYEEAAEHFPRGQAVAAYDLSPVYINIVGDVTLGELGDMYGHLLTEFQKEPPVHTITGRISLEERIALVRLQLVGQPRARFSDLTRSSSPSEVVVTFLAILQLVRLGEVHLVQARTFGEIDIEPLELEVEVRS